MKILVATDGSEYSKAAIEFCRNVVVEPEKTSIKIISSFERPMPIAGEPFAISAMYYNEIEQGGRSQSQEFVERAEEQVRSIFPQSSLQITTEALVGSPPRVIVEQAREWGADLIVIGSHGYGFWSRAVLGSVSSAVLHHAPCSVLVVRQTKEKK